jgi:hypothetical protein
MPKWQVQRPPGRPGRKLGLLPPPVPDQNVRRLPWTPSPPVRPLSGPEPLRPAARRRPRGVLLLPQATPGPHRQRDPPDRRRAPRPSPHRAGRPLPPMLPQPVLPRPGPARPNRAAHQSPAPPNLKRALPFGPVARLCVPPQGLFPVGLQPPLPVRSVPIPRPEPRAVPAWCLAAILHLAARSPRRVPQVLAACRVLQWELPPPRAASRRVGSRVRDRDRFLAEASGEPRAVRLAAVVAGPGLLGGLASASPPEWVRAVVDPSSPRCTAWVLHR